MLNKCSFKCSTFNFLTAQVSPVLRLLWNVIFPQEFNKNLLYLDVNVCGVSKSSILTLAGDSAATRDVYAEGSFQDLLQP